MYAVRFKRDGTFRRDMGHICVYARLPRTRERDNFDLIFLSLNERYRGGLVEHQLSTTATNLSTRAIVVTRHRTLLPEYRAGRLIQFFIPVSFREL